jgi:hypothetical protein
MYQKSLHHAIRDLLPDVIHSFAAFPEGRTVLLDPLRIPVEHLKWA